MTGDAELVAFRVGQSCPPDIPFVFVVNDGGAEAHEPFDFAGAIVGLEVEVNAVLDRFACGYLDKHHRGGGIWVVVPERCKVLAQRGLGVERNIEGG